MYTSMMALVLAFQVPAQGADGSSWNEDYRQALKQSQTQSKPMAIVLGSGEQGYTRLGLSKEALESMAANYICVYLDTANPKNKDLVAAFEMPGSKGLILSDRTGIYENYRQEGMLSSADLTSKLKQYSGMNVSTSTSLYGSYAQPAAYGQPGYNPVVQPPVNYCPSCGGGGRYR